MSMSRMSLTHGQSPAHEANVVAFPDLSRQPGFNMRPPILQQGLQSTKPCPQDMPFRANAAELLGCWSRGP